MDLRFISLIVVVIFCGMLAAPVMADEGYWKSRSIDTERDDLGLYCSLRIDKQDRSYIAYYSETDDSLHLAWEPYSWDSASASGKPFFAWSRITPAGSSLGKGVSLWVNDTDRTFAFSCVDSSFHIYLGEGGFRAAGRDGYAPYVVSMTDETTRYIIAAGPTSISRYYDTYGIVTDILYLNGYLQTPGLSRMSIYNCTDPLNQNCNGTTVQNRVFGRNNRGEGQSIARDVRNFGSYGECWYDNINGTLQYANLRYGGLHDVVDGSSRPAGTYCSLAYDSSGDPHISYQGIYDGGVLKYASKKDSNWTIETIDTTRGAGQYSSLVIDVNDEPHISYSTGGQLKYASKNGTEWYTQVVDTTPTEWTSIAVDSKNRPHIAYYDSRKGDLRFAWWEPYIRGRPFPR